MSGNTIVVTVSVLVGVVITVIFVWLSSVDTRACEQSYLPPRVPTKAELEKDARKHWDEQVRALGGVEDELFFYPPSDQPTLLYANKIVTKYLDGGCIDYYELRHTNLQRPGFDDSVVL